MHGSINLPTLQKWPLLTADDSSTPIVSCEETKDCDEHHICLNQTCIPQLLRGERIARYEEGVGCVCDPAFGQFGVRIEGLSDYVRGPGYNACASVFQTPLKQPIPVQVVTYFYLMQQPPVSFLQYEKIDASHVIAPLSSFIQNGKLQVGQEFPYDYMQVFFRERHPFTAKVRQFNFNETFYAKYPPTFIRKPNQMEWCRFMSRHLKEVFLPSEWAFNLLYTFPACYIGKNDQDAPEQYRGRYVSNPLHFTYGAYAEHPRFNGLLLKHERGDWTLEFAPEYDVDTYRSIANPQMVPFLNDPVVKMLEQGYMSKDPINEQNMLYRHQKRERENNNEPTF
ncbi:uncharacterized protein TNCV_298971 [Trichonephila clavipes]|nr:uncharacterized protein TNCV_298971 [Trichonephila clavipes]